MSVLPPIGSDQSNAKILSALTYPVPPIGLVILIFDTRKNPFIHKHAVQGLVLGVVLMVLNLILSIGLLPVVGCFVPLIWLISIIAAVSYGLQALMGREVTVPLVTDLCRNLRWI